MKIEEEIRALELLRGKLEVLNIPRIEYLFKYGRLFEGILTKKEEGVFLKNLEKRKVIELTATYDDELGKTEVLAGRKVKINTDKFTNYLRTIDKKYLGEIGEFDLEQNPIKPILAKEILKRLAIEIGNLDYFKNKDSFYDFSINCGVDKRFFYKPLSNIFHIIYPCDILSASNIYNTIKNPAPKPVYVKNEEIPEYKKGRCGDLFMILAYYSYSKNKNILFNILKNSVNPLLFKGNDEEMEKFEDKLNKYLKLGGYLLKKGAIKKISNSSDNEEEKKQQASNDVLAISFGKHKLEANKNTGAIKLNKCSNDLNPESQEFKTLIKLMTSKYHLVTYKELLGDNPTKPSKRNLGFTIRNLKQVLGILPKKNAENEDIIKNIKNHGYRIDT